jgi:hypothetical protein
MGFVTVNSPPITTGGLVTSTHVTGGVKLGVERSVNPTAFVGQERIKALPPRHNGNVGPAASSVGFSFPDLPAKEIHG